MKKELGRDRGVEREGQEMIKRMREGIKNMVITLSKGRHDFRQVDHLSRPQFQDDSGGDVAQSRSGE
jgi:hypothetical protein